MGIIAFGVLQVRGNNLVPNPPIKITAFNIASRRLILRLPHFNILESIASNLPLKLYAGFLLSGRIPTLYNVFIILLVYQAEIFYLQDGHKLERKLLFNTIILTGVLILLAAFPGCNINNSGDVNRDTLVQVSTIDTLINGIYDGIIDYKTLKQHGDFGIGTFDTLDGEMIAVDGKYYQIKADGKVYPVADTATTPFASVTFFDADWHKELPEGMTFSGLQTYLDSIIPTENIFYAIKVVGTFSYMKTRSVPAQEKPYPLLVEVAKNQPVFEFPEISGKVVGFRTPPFAAALNVEGYHLHFLDDEIMGGGHILEFVVKEAVVYIDYTSNFLMFLPESGDFYNLDLSKDLRTEVEQVEK